MLSATGWPPERTRRGQTNQLFSACGQWHRGFLRPFPGVLKSEQVMITLNCDLPLSLCVLERTILKALVGKTVVPEHQPRGAGKPV